MCDRRHSQVRGHGFNFDRGRCMKSQLAKRKISWTLLTVVPASLAVAGALVYRRYRRDLTAARARVSSGSRLVNTPSGLIEYADVGTGAPVLVIHGAGGGFDQGLEFARPLIDAGFRVIALVAIRLSAHAAAQGCFAHGASRCPRQPA